MKPYYISPCTRSMLVCLNNITIRWYFGLNKIWPQAYRLWLFASENRKLLTELNYDHYFTASQAEAHDNNIVTLRLGDTYMQSSRPMQFFSIGTSATNICEIKKRNTGIYFWKIKFQQCLSQCWLGSLTDMCATQWIKGRPTHWFSVMTIPVQTADALSLWSNISVHVSLPTCLYNTCHHATQRWGLTYCSVTPRAEKIIL